MLKQMVSAIAIIALTGAGCVPATIMTGTQNPSAASAAWRDLGSGVRRYECPASVCDARLILYRFAKNDFSWGFASRNTPSTVEAWAGSLPNAIFVVNGVFFDHAWQPTGMLKTSGQFVNDREYDFDKSGLLELSPLVKIFDTATEKIDLASMIEAAQNFPLLVKKGVPVLEFKDTNAARRTFIGTDENGDVYAGVVAEDAITFSALAKLLVETGVKWDNVLNLDGGTSTGFAARLGDWSESMNSIVQVPNVIVATKK